MLTRADSGRTTAAEHQDGDAVRGDDRAETGARTGGVLDAGGDEGDLSR